MHSPLPQTCAELAEDLLEFRKLFLGAVEQKHEASTSREWSMGDCGFCRGADDPRRRVLFEQKLLGGSTWVGNVSHQELHVNKHQLVSTQLNQIVKLRVKHH